MNIWKIVCCLIILCNMFLYSNSEVLFPIDEPMCPFENSTNLDLSGNQLTRIKASFVKGSNIRCLNLNNNSISEIDRAAFDDISELIYLNLAENSFLYKQFEFEKFTTVEILVLNHALVNPRYDYQTGYTRGYQNYGMIDEQNGISAIHLSDFTILPNLKKLYLCSNNIKSLQTTSLMNNMPNLTHLYLNENLISHTDFLRKPPVTLSHLYLNNNHMTNFSCKKLMNLKVLVMDHNSFKSLCGNDEYCDNGISLKGAINLQNFSISNVGLREIASDAFEDQFNLRILDISHNSIQKLVRHTMDNLTNLTILRLSNNELTAVPDLSKLENIEILQFAHNKINSIDEFIFNNLKKLKTLDLSNNKLQIVGPNTFNLISLENLNLSSNALDFLSAKWCSENCSLRRLDLAKNLFSKIVDMSLKNIVTLEYLNFDKNPITQVNVESLLFLPRNTTINIDNVNEQIQPSSSMDIFSMGDEYVCDKCRERCYY